MHTAFFATFHNTACWLAGDDDVVDGQDGEDDDLSDGCGTVSYTHLTLPTIYSV